MRVGFFVVFFLIFCAFFLISNENLHLSVKDEAYKFGNMYYNWIINLADVSTGLVGYVVKADWLPVNSTSG